MGWSQRKLAKELRVTPGAVSQWESRQRAIPGPVQRLIEIYERELGMVEPPLHSPIPKLNGSWAHRTLRTSTTTAKIVTRLAGSSLTSLVVSNARATEIKRATQVAIGKELASSLGDMKGLLMKFGQMLGYLDFAAPEPVRRALRSLQDETRPMSESAVETVFRDSMGALPERIFDQWEPRPVAAASIGQVHRARLRDGTDVAVKVQYPNVRRAIESDFDNLTALAKVTQLVFRAEQREELLKELKDRVLEECDYLREAENQDTFRRHYADIPEVVIPRVHREFSNDRILTTDFVDARNFSAFVRSADQRSKDRAGETIFRMATGSLFRHRVFNADPHPGNYLFLESGQVAFLDFGCVKRFPRGLLEHWARYALAIMDGRRREEDKLFVKMGFVEDPDRFDFEYHHEMMTRLYEPWSTDGPFRFNHHYVERNWRAMVVENPNKARLRMPPDFLFMNRLHWGLHSVLADLGAEAVWKPILRSNLTSCIDGRPD